MPFQLPPSPFHYRPINELLELLNELYPSSLAAQLNRKFYDGDHWQNGQGWIGPSPATDDPTYHDIMAEIEAVFCSRNVIREVVDRKVDGLLKRTPRMAYITPKDQTTPDTPDPATSTPREIEAGNLFKRWAKDNKLLKQLKKVHSRSQLGENPVLRLYIPRGFLVPSPDNPSVSSVPEGTIEECLSLIKLEVVHSGTAGLITDKETQREAIIYHKVDEDEEYVEVTYEDNGETVIRTALIATSSSPSSRPVRATEGNTSFEVAIAGEKITSPDSNTQQDTEYEWRLPLGGLLTMHAPKIPSPLTEQVRQNQLAINLAKTMMNRNNIMAGFLERVITDAMPPGEWVQDPDDPDNPEAEIYELHPFKLGPGTTTFLMAGEYNNPLTGEKWFGSPGVHYRDPASPDTFIASCRACYQDILEEVGQPHVLISSVSGSSGKSREQAREMFYGTLDDDEEELNATLEWAMLATLRMAAYLAGTPDHFEGLEAEGQCFISVGPMTGTERQDTRQNVLAALLSQRTAMTRDGVEDPEAELNRIREEELYSSSGQAKKIEMIKQLGDVGVDVGAAALLVGFTEEQAASLQASADALRKLKQEQETDLIEAKQEAAVDAQSHQQVPSEDHGGIPASVDENVTTQNGKRGPDASPTTPLSREGQQGTRDRQARP